MTHRFILLILFTCGIIFLSSGQITTSKQLSPKDVKNFAEAKQLSQKGELRESIKIYEKLVKANPDFIEGMLRLATNYHSVKEYNKAEKLFIEAIRKAPDFDSEMYYSLAMVMKDQNKLTDAIAQLELYAAKDNKNPGKVKRAKFQADEFRFRLNALKNPVPFAPVRLNEKVNSHHSEYSPSLSLDDSGLIFTRNNGQEDLFFAKKDQTGTFVTSAPLLGLNTHQNEGAHTMSADGNVLVFTACDRKDSYGSCDLYSATLVDGKWTKPVNMGQKVNSIGWDSQPQLSPDGNTLYFSSKRKGCIGESDIWMTYRDEKNAWIVPVNLGSVINTEGHDETPFLHPDGQTLYFRSDGRPGMGGFDIYYSRKDSATGTWQTPVNLGYPINTENQEGGLVVSLDGKSAYYASDINPVTGKSIGNLDIFMFELYEKSRPQPSIFVRGKIHDALSGEPVSGFVKIVELASGLAHYSHFTDKSGQFLSSVSAKKMYACIVQKDGYKYFSQNFDLRQMTAFTEPYILDIRLVPESKMTESPPAVLQNIFFKTGSAELLPESMTEIELLYQLLVSQKNIGILIIGHTDSEGNDKDNQNLSEARADSVVRALSEKGIEKSRLKAEGRGESQPIESNDTESGRQKNRRTEFLIFNLKI